MTVYADNGATTRMCREAIDAMLPHLDISYGNPSSVHALGQEAKKALVSAREAMAEHLGCLPGELTFTSGGSEADNQAILSAAALGERQGKKHILSTAIEHHAVLGTLEKLSRQGFDVTLLPVDENGLVTPDQVAGAIRADTCLVSVMYANNEIGAVQPISGIGRACRERGVLFHTDAVAAAGHLPIDVGALNIDLLSLSAHKFHGPKGAGALYAARGLPLASLIEGGAQERGKRAGTENVPAVAGMAAAFRQACLHMAENRAKVSALRDRLIDGLLETPRCVLNGGRPDRLPGNVSLCFEGIDGESLLLLLSMAGVCASAGSACASGALDPSHVLLAIGRPPALARSTLRLTLSELNTEEEVDYLLKIIPETVNRLRDQSCGGDS